MANPAFIFDNIFDADGVADPTLVTIAGEQEDLTADEAAGSPVENIKDWRMGTPYRWKGLGSGFSTGLRAFAGAAQTFAPNVLVIAGHNFYDPTNSDITLTVQWSDTGANASWNNSSPFTTSFLPTSAFPIVMNGTSTPAAKAYWRVRIANAGASSITPQAGIVVLGRKLVFSAGALPGLDPLGFSVQSDRNDDMFGSPIGINVRSKKKMFNLNYGGSSDPGFLATEFFTTVAPNMDDDFIPHAITNAKPFFFAWDIVNDPDSTTLGRADSIRMPFVGTTLRRGMNMDITGYREIS